MITNFVEKPEVPTGDLAFSGVMIGTSAMLDKIPPVSPVDIGYHLLPRLAGRMAGFVIEEYLKDIGTLAAYAEAQREWRGLHVCGESRSRHASSAPSRQVERDVEHPQEASC